MIIRVMGGGQYTIPDDARQRLNEADDEIEKAVASNDQEQLTHALEHLIGLVREVGAEVPDDVLADSDLILPDASARLEEIRAWLDDTSEYAGLIPD